MAELAHTYTEAQRSAALLVRLFLAPLGVDWQKAEREAIEDPSRTDELIRAGIKGDSND